MSAYSSMCKKIQFQGTVTILGSDCDRGRACAARSLRRTLSADMSSQKWLSQNALMKKIASSQDLSHFKKATTSPDSSLSSSEGEEDIDYEEMKRLEAEEAEQERFQVWSTTQRGKKEHHHEKEPAAAQFDTWSSILLSHKAKEETLNSLVVTPYVHPLVKGSKSSLSEKSLVICTESLGSETGSDHVFSSSSNSSPSETEDSEEEQGQEQQQHVTVQMQEHDVPKHIHHVAVKKSKLPRCFPPPLPSLHMRSHRDGNGRLFLEVVPLVASQKDKFCAQRQDGRLVLTFAAGEEEEEESKENDGEVAEEEEEEYEKDQVGELEKEFVEFEDDDDEGKEYEEDENYDEGGEDDEILEVEGGERDDAEAVIEEAPLLSSVVTSSFHRLALMMNKPTGVVNWNTKWSEKFNHVVNFEDVSVAQSFPPRPSVARLIPSRPTMAPVAAASLNAYECYWGTKHTSKVASVPTPLSHQQNKHSSVKNNSSKLIVCGDNNWSSNDGQQLVVMRGKNGDYLVHNSKSCKDSRWSFLFWEPQCIAT